MMLPPALTSPLFQADALFLRYRNEKINNAEKEAVKFYFTASLFKLLYDFKV